MLLVKIAVNNQHVADFNHRMPFTAADTVSIQGDLNLADVQIYPGFSQQGQPWRFSMVRMVITVISVSIFSL